MLKITFKLLTLIHRIDCGAFKVRACNLRYLKIILNIIVSEWNSLPIHIREPISAA